MSGYVRRVTADPGSDVRVNRAGSVIVEDNTFDSDAKALRDSEYVPRVYSKDKPDARAGYADGGYDPARSEADEILRRVERSAKRRATKDEGHRADVARSLGLTDVAPYGMTLEPGAGTAARRGEAAPPGKRRRAAADEDAERRKKPEGKSVRRGGDVARRGRTRPSRARRDPNPRVLRSAAVAFASRFRKPRRPGSPARREASLGASFRERAREKPPRRERPRRERPRRTAKEDKKPTRRRVVTTKTKTRTRKRGALCGRLRRKTTGVARRPSRRSAASERNPRRDSPRWASTPSATSPRSPTAPPRRRAYPCAGCGTRRAGRWEARGRRDGVSIVAYRRVFF